MPEDRKRRILCGLFALGMVCLSASESRAQQTWQVAATVHFDCYFEVRSQHRIDRLLFEAERAYTRISLDLRHDLADRVLLIFVDGDRGRNDILAQIQRSTPLGRYLLVVAETDDQIEALLSHELTHQFESELVPNRVSVPPWMLEGLAEFERTRWMPSQPARLSVIVPISQLTTVDRDGARAVVSFIADEYGTAGIRRLLATLRDTPGDGAIERAFGVSLYEFESRFEAYMKAY